MKFMALLLFSLTNFTRYAYSDYSGLAASQHEAVLIAQDSQSKNKRGKQRPKNISSEAASKDKKKVDFEEIDISGQRKTPLGSLINQNKQQKEYDFVKIRTNWHIEMIESGSMLANF